MAKDIFSRDYILLDGAMGTMLQKKGMEIGTIPETLNITRPDWIVAVSYTHLSGFQSVSGVFKGTGLLAGRILPIQRLQK